MATINSVLGPLDTANLGFTLMHEHFASCAAAGAPQNYPELFMYGPRFVDRLVDSLTKAKKGGVDTIVDATTIDLSRDVNMLAEISRRSGVNIIACTGLCHYGPRFLNGISADQFAQVFVREIREGIAGTGIKAGILKEASDIEGVTPPEEAVLRGVARAHLQTNVPIMLHSYAAREVGRRQLAILKEEGVNLKRVKVDHANDTTDLEYLNWLLDQGAYLGLDRYPGRIPSATARTKTMKALIDAGYVDRLCPSHDRRLINHKAEALPKDSPLSPEGWERGNPHEYLYIKNVVFPQLREMGVSEAILNRLCVNAPRNFFEGV